MISTNSDSTGTSQQQPNSPVGVIVVVLFCLPWYRFRRRHSSPLVSSHVIFARVGALPSSQKSWNEGY